MLNLKHFLNTNKLLKNANVSQLRTGKNPKNALYSETDLYIDETKIIKNKNNKRSHAFKNYAHIYTVTLILLKSIIFLIQNYNSKILYPQSKIN